MTPMFVVMQLFSMISNYLFLMMVVLFILLGTMIPLVLFSVFALIGSIFFCIFLFGLSDDQHIGVFKPAGIFMILFPAIGALLIYIGLKKV